MTLLDSITAVDCLEVRDDNDDDDSGGLLTVEVA